MEAIEAILNDLFEGVLDYDQVALLIGFELHEAYYDGWNEATNGKWGLPEDNPWPNPDEYIL